jgi:FtsP/CotA-like multicopper oxidase with cupredoxin domain
MEDIKRRDFLKYAGGTIGALVVGNGLPWISQNEVYAAVRVQSIDLEMTDAMKNMATWTSVSNPTAQCYHWIYKDATNTVRPDCPGPVIFCTEGDLITVKLANKLDEDHNFFIQGVVNSGPIAPGAVRTIRFKAPRGGSYLYHDNLNAPVNRVMGLHGALISMPRAPRPGHKFTPYSRPSLGVQKLFDDFGSSTHFPGLAWEQGDPNPATFTPAFRQYIWLLHQPSSRLFAEAGNAAPGTGARVPATFIEAFTNDPFQPDSALASGNRKPDYFTISGQSGHFSHNNPFLCPNLRVGEPCILRLMNAGLQTHSMHIHANHQFITYDSFKGGVQENPVWIDVYTLSPLRVVDYVNPYMRPPDIPNRGGIGPMHVNIPAIGGFADDPRPTTTGGTTWPPNEELALVLPATGGLAAGLTVQLSPICYPMHDHTENSQVAQGGNYNMGMISGMNITGDRNAPGGVNNFPNLPAERGPEFSPNTVSGLVRPDGPEPA